MFSPGRMKRFPLTEIICTLKNLISLSVKQGRGILLKFTGSIQIYRGILFKFTGSLKSSPLNLKVTLPSQIHKYLGFESTWTTFDTTGVLWLEALLPIVSDWNTLNRAFPYRKYLHKELTKYSQKINIAGS